MFSFLSQFLKLRKLQSEHTHTNKINRYASRPCRNSVRGALLPNSFCVTLEHSFTHTVTLRRSANELVDRHVMRMERFALKFLEHDILRKHTRELIKRNDETMLTHWIDSVLELIDHKTLNCAVRQSCRLENIKPKTNQPTDCTKYSSRCLRVFQFLS